MSDPDTDWHAFYLPPDVPSELLYYLPLPFCR